MSPRPPPTRGAETSSDTLPSAPEGASGRAPAGRQLCAGKDQAAFLTADLFSKNTSLLLDKSKGASGETRPGQQGRQEDRAHCGHTAWGFSLSLPPLIRLRRKPGNIPGTISHGHCPPWRNPGTQFATTEAGPRGGGAACDLLPGGCAEPGPPPPRDGCWSRLASAPSAEQFPLSTGVGNTTASAGSPRVVSPSGHIEDAAGLMDPGNTTPTSDAHRPSLSGPTTLGGSRPASGGTARHGLRSVPASVDLL